MGYNASPTLQGSDRTIDSNPNPSGTTPGTLPGGSSDLTVDFGYYVGTPNLGITKTADNSSITAGSPAGYTVTISNTGNGSATGLTLTDPLPSGGGDINWTIDTSKGNPNDFSISGAAGSQSLALSSYFINTVGDYLAPGQSISVHITSPTNAGDANFGTPASSFNNAGTAAAGVISLGTANNYSVLGLNNTTITNSLVTIYGNEGVSQGGSLSNMAPSTITGNVYEYASGQYSGPGKLGGSVIVNSTLLAQNDTDALNASTTAKALTATQTFGSITSATTVTGNGGLNVIDINGNINLNNASLILSGSASDVIIVNVTGTASFVGTGGLSLAGGVTPNHVLYNFTGSSGTIASHVGNVFYGTLLAPTYSFNLDGSFIGEIIGGGSSIQLLSNAAVNANVGSVLPNTATVSETNESGSQSATATITINSGVPQLAAGSSSSAGAGVGELLGWGAVQTGPVGVAIELPQGSQTAAELAAIGNAIASLNSQVAPLGVSLVVASGANAASAPVHITMASSSAIGGVDQGVLGAYTPGGDITLITGSNWYFGSDPGKIAQNQFDFQTVVTHELGHVLGLGENSDPSSVMDLYLSPGEVRRDLTADDLSAIQEELQASPAPLPATASGDALAVWRLPA